MTTDAERRPLQDAAQTLHRDPTTLQLGPDEALLSQAIDTAEIWIHCSDPAIRHAFRLALAELLALLPEGIGR